MRVLMARLDNHGDVLLTGPAVRAVAAGGSEVVYLCRPNSTRTARLLPYVGRIVSFEAAWVSGDPVPVFPASLDRLIDDIRSLGVDQAVIFTSFHQSPLPLALLLRLAGVGCIAAISEDHPGTLLDVRHRVPGPCHEVERNLSLVATLGYHLPAGDDGRLAIRPPASFDPRRPPEVLRRLRPGYVVVHPGASAPAHALPQPLAAEAIAALAAGGWPVAVTGSAGDWVPSTAAAPGVVNLVGHTDLDAMAQVLAGARALVAGNSEPVHLAAAVGTPVVSVLAPTLAVEGWHPWRVPFVTLGDQAVACHLCRSRSCPLLRQPCAAQVGPDDVLAAVVQLAGSRRAAA